MDTSAGYHAAGLLVSVAGLAAEKIALRGHAPGWTRLLSRPASVAYHESGHAVAVAAVGAHVYRLSVDAEGGLCRWGFDPKPSGAQPKGADVADSAHAACAAAILTDALEGDVIQPVVDKAHRKAEAILLENWATVERLAFELRERGALEQDEIATILSRVARRA